ncbi:hypothetical protein PMPD1_2448 [Paramixta manurensis]|uniref:Large polyvalent protein-associated domain-containing protein n=1 Tax=Paramixta manurensis TaxID=2740817 RepID=A0A6M8UI29_9GAMM|nr:hypothetical protein PMPD1_2448 [Erwiniaceae bacterium PD-1]
MAEDMQQYRPEQQSDNDNRQTLNISQPGEREPFDLDAALEKAKAKVNPSLTKGDIVRTVAAVPFDVTESIAQLPKGLNDVANRYATSQENEAQSRLGISDNAMNTIKGVRNDIASGVDNTFGSVGRLAKKGSEAIKEGYSEGAKQAAALPFIEKDAEGGYKVGPGAFDKDAWIINATPTLAQMFTVAGIAKFGASKVAKIAEDMAYKSLSRQLPDEVARATAKEAAQVAGDRAQKKIFVGGMTASAQGQGGIDMRDQITSLPFDQLMQSPTFQKAFDDVDTDDAYANLSDTQKLTMARNMVAEQAASSVTADPRMLAVNIAAASLGDHTLLSLLTKKGAASGVLSGVATGALAEGGTEFAQGATQQYLQNQQLKDTAGQDIDPMKGVVDTGLNNALLGAGMGAAAGAIGGVRGRKNNTSARSNEGDPAIESPPNDEGTKQESESPATSDDVTPVASSSPTPDLDTPAYLRNDPRIQGFADDSEVQQALGQDAAPTPEELIRQQIQNGDQGLTPDEQATLADADARRQARIPRLPAPGDTSLAEGYQMPGPVANIDEQQAGSGPQFRGGEQVRGQRLLPREDEPKQEVGRASNTYEGETVPGDAIEDKNIIFQPGNSDESQAGRSPDFTRGETAPQRQMREFTQAMGNENTPPGISDQRVRAGDTPIDRETAAVAKGAVPTRLQFFSPGKPFSTEKVARYSKWAKMPGASVEKVEGGYAVRLPDKSKAASVPADPDLKLYQPGKPFSNERVARFSKWAKMPGATIEKVGNGYGVRLPSAQPKIEDFGEKLQGAAKDRWGQFRQAMQSNNTVEDIGAQPLSRTFPRPDYEALHAAGISHKGLSMVAVFRSMIGTKPTMPGRVKRWAEQAHELREMANEILDGKVDPDEMHRLYATNPKLRDITDTLDLMAKLPAGQVEEASRYRLRTHHYSMYNGTDYSKSGGKTIYELEDLKGKSVRGVSDETKEGAIKKAVAYVNQSTSKDGVSTVKQSKLEIYRDRHTGERFIAYKGATGLVPLKSGFKDATEARTYLNENRDELEKKLSSMRETSRTEQRNAENRKRTGPAVRDSAATPESFTEKFGFRGVQFGNYVEGARRQKELNEAYDALTDMADVLNVPTQALSLNGNLGLAFGARGRGGLNAAKAHYEPGQVVINLTKGNGSGSLAHEWFHALDNFFGQSDVGRDGEVKSGDNFMSSSRRRAKVIRNGRFVDAEHPVRQEVYNAFRGVMDAIDNSGMVGRARNLDSVRSKAYWSTNVELAARAFERYMLDKTQAKGIDNDYLVNIWKGDEANASDTYAYPTDKELSGGIRQAFDHLFATLKTRKTDRGTTFYSRYGGEDIGDGNIITREGWEPGVDKPARGLTRHVAQVAADGFVKKMNGAAKIKVKVVQSQDEAAAMMPNGIPKEYGVVHAIYQPELSRVIVVADNIPTLKDLNAKLRHEILAHHGLASVIGDVEYDRIIRVLHQTRQSPNKAIQEVWGQVDRSYKNESLETQANEFLAHMAENTSMSKFGAVYDRIAGVLVNALRKAGLISQNITPVEVRNILRTIAGRFKRTAMHADEQPGTREFEDTFSRADALYSKGNDDVDPLKPLPHEAEQYRTDLDKAMRSLKSGEISIKIGRTPPVLRAMGAPNLDMVITRDTVRKASNGAKHDVPMDVIERLPELFHDPEAVFESKTKDNAASVLLSAKDTTGRQVMAAVHMNIESGRMVINRIASVYGREAKQYQNWIDEGLLRYRRNKKENPDNPHSQGLQLPKEERSYQGSEPSSGTTQGLQLPQRGSPDVGSSQNILTSADIRKNKTFYSRAAAPAMDDVINRKMGFRRETGWFDKAKTFYDTFNGKDKAAKKAWLSDSMRQLNTRTFDGLAPIKYAEDEAGKSQAESSAYVAARMAAGSGSVTAATLEHGLPQYNAKEGVIERKAGTTKADSLMGVLDGLGNHREDFFKWIAGHRSERLMKEGRENLFTAQEIDFMKSLDSGREKLFADQKAKYDAFIKSIMDLQQDMGLIDPESRAQWEDAWYIPYYRETEDGGVRGPWSTRGIANQRSTVRQLKGGEQNIKDPVENLFNYVSKAIDSSMKNEAMRRTVVNLADTGMIDVIESPNKIDYQQIGKGVAKVFIDGKETLVRVHNDEVYRAMTMIDMERSNSVFLRAARQAKRVLTIGTTSMPDFILRNFLRDSLHSWAINKDGFTPVKSSFEGLKKAIKGDDTLVDMMFAGATFGGGYSNVYDPAGTARNIRSILRRKGYTDSQVREFESSIVTTGRDAMNKLNGAFEKYKHVSEAAENANRIATYDAAIKSGKSKAQAAFESRDLMDFSMQGSGKIMMTLSDVLPFFNARMQGFSKLGRAVKADPAEVLKRGGIIAAASVALMAANLDNEKYEELPDWDKDTYWHFFLGDQHFRIPKPFEIGLMFGTMPERLMRAIAGKDSGAKFAKLAIHNFMEQIAFNPVPQVALPIAEAYVNYDSFTGNPIENMSDGNLLASARYNDHTSMIARKAGEAFGWSPKKIDHIITGYTGTLGAYVLGASDMLIRGMGDYGETPALRTDELPVLKSFLRGSDPAKSTQFTEDFYQMMQKANEVYSTINAFRKQGRFDDAQELQEENRKELSQRKGLNATQKQVRALNGMIEMVKSDRILSADEKKDRINKLLARRNKIVQQAVQRINPYFDVR